MKNKKHNLSAIVFYSVIITLNFSGCQKLGTDQEFSFPSWTGNYSVGTKSVILTDESRDETFTPSDPDDRRKLIVEFFYPTVANDGDTEQLEVIPDSLWRSTSELGVFWTDYYTGDKKFLRRSNYRKATWNISKNTPVSSEKEAYPVLVFSHGYGLLPAYHVSILGELASRGYIIAAINHTYGSRIAEFPGEQPVYTVPLPEDNPGAFMPIWSDDQIFVINQIVSLNDEPSSFLHNRVDVNRIGVFGHSYGGGASYHSAAKDARIVAAMDLDGYIFDFEDASVQQPFVLLNAYDPANDPGYDDYLISVFGNVNNDGYFVFVDNATHHTFTDFPVWYQWDYPQDAIFGSIDPLRGQELVTEFIAQFFDKYFYNVIAPWFDEPDSMPIEATVEKK